MKLLEHCQVMFAASSGAAAQQQPRIDALTRAGARVRTCTLGAELWSHLSEGGVDLVIAWLESGEPAARATLDQLRADARQRGISTLLMTEDPTLARERCALWAAQGLDDEAFVSAAADLFGPVKQLREQQELARSLRLELIQAETHVRGLTHELSELGHESRTMLNAMMGIACNLRDELHGSLTEEQIEQVRAIVTAVDRTQLLFSRAQASESARSSLTPRVSSTPPRAQRCLVQVAQLAAEVCSVLEGVAERKGLELKSALDDSVYVWGDPLKLKQLLTNLVVNAIKYTPQGSVELRVAWTTPDAHTGLPARRNALITVSDTGPGIPEEIRPLIWQRGFRASQHAQQQDGEGIGLFVVHEVVQQHGGSVDVGNAAEGGAIFSVTLPQDRRLRARPSSEQSLVT
jgi:signal transduction histidine kinase